MVINEDTLTMLHVAVNCYSIINNKLSVNVCIYSLFCFINWTTLKAMNVSLYAFDSVCTNYTYNFKYQSCFRQKCLSH